MMNAPGSRSFNRLMAERRREEETKEKTTKQQQEGEEIGSDQGKTKSEA